LADKDNNGVMDITDMVQETHYEPFGLTLAGQSYDASTTNKNKIKFQGQELQDGFELGWYHFKWRMHSPEIGRFMVVDPLAEKYVYNSPYAFSENRVIDGVEMEGLEVSLFNYDKELKKGNQSLFETAQNWKYYSSTLISLWAHGNEKSIADDKYGFTIDGSDVSIQNFNYILALESKVWGEKTDKEESKKGIRLVLYSCRTGADVKDEDGNIIDIPIAQKISANDAFKDVLIFAPDQYLFDIPGYGPFIYKGKGVGKNDLYPKGTKLEDKVRSETFGNWKVFKNGEHIRTYYGKWTPVKSYDSIYDIIWRLK
jgi:RHS repeat-associated protein